MTYVSQIEQRVILTVAIIASFFNPFMGAAVNVALPVISKELDMGAVGMSWVSMSYLLASAIFMVPFGKLADIAGRKKIFLYGNIVLLIGTLLCAFASSSTSLNVGRFVQGIGSAAAFGSSMALVISVFPPNQRGKVIGYVVSSVYLGLTLSPVLGGFMIQGLGWRSLFYLNAITGTGIIITLYVGIKHDWAEAHGEKLDILGSVVYMISMLMLMYGFSGLPETKSIILTSVGLIGLVFFVKIELNKNNPVLEIRLFSQNRVFAFSNLAAMINYAATFAVSFIMSLYLQYIKGFNPAQAGMVIIAQPAVMALVATFSGRLSDKHNPGVLASIGMSIMVVGLFLFIFLNDETPISYLVTGLIILGTGFGLFSSPNTNAVMGSVEKKFLGIASATISTMRLTGQMTSMAIATLVIQIFVGNNKITPKYHAAFSKGMDLIFIIFSILCILGVFASLARSKKKMVTH